VFRERREDSPLQKKRLFGLPDRRGKSHPVQDVRKEKERKNPACFPTWKRKGRSYVAISAKGEEGRETGPPVKGKKEKSPRTFSA